MLDFNDIQKLMDEFNGSDMRELEITSEGFHIHLSKNEVFFEKPVIAKESSEKPAIEAVEDVSALEKSEASEKDDVKAIRAPMVGTIYLKPEPDKDPYVTEGMRVHKGDIVCIIEAMKMMTEIKSDLDGVISEVLVENEDLVEFDQPLFKVKEG